MCFPFRKDPVGADLSATPAVDTPLLVVEKRSRLGSEFMPQLHEGSLLFMPTTVPGVGPSAPPSWSA